jgi:aryl-alcohol dehydrogenase-like predicted oxidoreductase
VVIGGAEPLEGSIEEPLAVLAEPKNRGLIRHLGVSNVTPNQLIEAQKITKYDERREEDSLHFLRAIPKNPKKRWAEEQPS